MPIVTTFFVHGRKARIYKCHSTLYNSRKQEWFAAFTIPIPISIPITQLIQAKPSQAKTRRVLPLSSHWDIILHQLFTQLKTQLSYIAGNHRLFEKKKKSQLSYKRYDSPPPKYTTFHHLILFFKNKKTLKLVGDHLAT